MSLAKKQIPGSNVYLYWLMILMHKAVIKITRANSRRYSTVTVLSGFMFLTCEHGLLITIRYKKYFLQIYLYFISGPTT